MKFNSPKSECKISAFVLGYNVDSTTRSVLQGLIYGDGRYFDVKDSAQMLVALNSITTNLNISQSGWDNGVYDFQINFDHDSDKIKPEFQDNVKRLAEYLKQSGNTAQIQEHTDNVGDEKYNKSLSQRRANSVKLELIKYGDRQINCKPWVTAKIYQKPKTIYKKINTKIGAPRPIFFKKRLEFISYRRFNGEISLFVV